MKADIVVALSLTTTCNDAKTLLDSGKWITVVVTGGMHAQFACFYADGVDAADR